MDRMNVTLTQVVQIITDLKEVFKFTEKVIPLLQDLVEFMRDVVPLLEEINDRISESTAKMPTASNKIDSVTSATEMATTEILDRVDVISNMLNEINSVITSVEEKQETKQKLFEELLNEAELTEKGKEIAEELRKVLAFNDEIKITKEKIDNINMETYNITLALQVQDITAQQLAAVNHLIVSVNDKLSKLINNIHSNNIEHAPKFSSELTAPEKTTFDPNAQFDRTGDRQKEIDDLINQHSQKDDKDLTSQDEIDKLFSGDNNE